MSRCHPPFHGIPRPLGGGVVRCLSHCPLGLHVPSGGQWSGHQSHCPLQTSQQHPVSALAEQLRLGALSSSQGPGGPLSLASPGKVAEPRARLSCSRRGWSPGQHHVPDRTLYPTVHLQVGYCCLPWACGVDGCTREWPVLRGSCLNPVYWARGQLPLNGRHSLDGPRAEALSTRPQGLDTVLGVRTCQCVQPALLMWSLVCRDFGSPFLSNQMSASKLCPTHQPAALQPEEKADVSPRSKDHPRAPEEVLARSQGAHLQHPADAPCAPESEGTGPSDG